MDNTPSADNLPPALSKFLKQGYSLTAAYAYLDDSGEPVFWRIRLDHPTKIR